MQIHEITQSAQQPVNEVLGALAQGAAALGKGIAGAAAQNFAQSQGQNLNAPNKVLPAGRQQAAGEMSKALLKPLADRMRVGWAQALQGMVARATNPTNPRIPATSPADLRDDIITKGLYNYLNTLLGWDVSTLINIDDTGQAALLDKELDQYITAAVVASKNPKMAQDQIWLNLATAIQRAQNIKQSKSGEVKPAQLTYGTDGKLKFNGQPYNANDLSHRMAVKVMLKQDPATYRP